MTNQNSLEDILYFHPHKGYSDEWVITGDTKAAILAWHQEATTKELLALIGNDEYEPGDMEMNAPVIRNNFRAQLRKSIQAREDNQ